MSILRSIWRVLVGVKDALVLLLLCLFFIGLFGALAGRGSLKVPDGGALVLRLDGAIVDQASEGSAFENLSGNAGPHEMQVRDVLRAINTARTDKRIKALVLDLDGLQGAGQANLQAIGDALTAFKKAGKPIHAWATAYGDDGYYLAAHASKAWVAPLGGVLLAGPGGTGPYFKRALDKLAVDVNVFRVGTYKAAVEPFTRSSASPEARAAEQALVDSLWASWLADVKAARPKAEAAAYIAQLPQRLGRAGGDEAKTALQSGLVDVIASHRDFEDAMIELVGEADDQKPWGDFNGIGLNRYLAATAGDLPTKGPAVGVVYVTGNIVDGEAQRGTAGGTSIAQAIRDTLADNDDIKALVVRVDSGGGSVLASEEIRQALADAKADGLPVVASFGPVAASGGYWVAMAADEIYAAPSTITGSIGVFAIIPSINRALANYGIDSDGVKATPYSGEPDVLHGLGPEVRQVLQMGVENTYGRFTNLVASNRKLPLADVERVAEGRVWAGTAAKELKLIDGFGGLDVAVAAAARRAKLKGDVRTVDIEPETEKFLAFLENFTGPEDDAEAMAARDPWSALAARSRVRLLTAAADVAQMLNGGATMQAACLECAAAGSPRPVVAKQGEGLLARLAGLFQSSR